MEYSCIQKSQRPHRYHGFSPMVIPCLQTSSILGSYPRVDRLYSDGTLLILYLLSFFLSCNRWEERLPHSTSMSWSTLMVFDMTDNSASQSITEVRGSEFFLFANTFLRDPLPSGSICTPLEIKASGMWMGFPFMILSEIKAA